VPGLQVECAAVEIELVRGVVDRSVHAVQREGVYLDREVDRNGVGRPDSIDPGVVTVQRIGEAVEWDARIDRPISAGRPVSSVGLIQCAAICAAAGAADRTQAARDKRVVMKRFKSIYAFPRRGRMEWEAVGG
jgi:hypothetical protein